MALFQVTSLSTGSVKTILVPSVNTKAIVIQNLGAGAVNITIDGGSTYTNTYPIGTAATGTDPTTGATGLGIQIPAAANSIPGSWSITTTPGSSGLNKPIRAIMASGTTTLNITTDDSQATCPLT